MSAFHWGKRSPKKKVEEDFEDDESELAPRESRTTTFASRRPKAKSPDSEQDTPAESRYARFNSRFAKPKAKNKDDSDIRYYKKKKRKRFGRGKDEDADTRNFTGGAFAMPGASREQKSGEYDESLEPKVRTYQKKTKGRRFGGRKGNENSPDKSEAEVTSNSATSADESASSSGLSDNSYEFDKRAPATRGYAVKKAMDYLASRDHSRSEIETKLKRLELSPEDIAHALEYVEEGGWLISPEIMAQKVADQLHRKKKSYFYIQNYLRGKKLPSVARDADQEREKARSLVEGRFSRLSKRSQADNKKITQFLKFRGFDPDTIRWVINETSGHSQSL